ncbi:hypothetical protein I79_008008 [Cricetulus griseus]|uniref:Uncharacterized protein n=1 Tax=Cricetulus griseus TaxID=10029 RepID=G3HC58_CRIGR|nr:hypothetical protein I79_008008 [Cricetulus griseus]
MGYLALQSSMRVHATSTAPLDTALQSSMRMHAASTAPLDTALSSSMRVHAASTAPLDTALQSSMRVHAAPTALLDTALQSGMRVHAASTATLDTALQSGMDVHTTPTAPPDAALQSGMRVPAASTAPLATALQSGRDVCTPHLQRRRMQHCSLAGMCARRTYSAAGCSTAVWQGCVHAAPTAPPDAALQSGRDVCTPHLQRRRMQHCSLAGMCARRTYSAAGCSTAVWQGCVHAAPTAPPDAALQSGRDVCTPHLQRRRMQHCSLAGMCARRTYSAAGCSTAVWQGCVHAAPTAPPDAALQSGMRVHAASTATLDTALQSGMDVCTPHL